jgi:DNA-3-methyladenine glycosylase
VRPWPRQCYARPVLEVARALLGQHLVRVTDEGTVVLRLTEVEAYGGADDPGSHSFRGRTPRNAVMFGPAGHSYVYFTYGMHHCCNVVCGPVGQPSAVLLRAGEVVDGLETARGRRGRSTDRDLARGPGRLCQALGIDLADNGLDLAGHLRAGAPIESVSTGPRVGLRLAAERPWRFWITGEATVSRYVPAKPKAQR